MRHVEAAEMYTLSLHDALPIYGEGAAVEERCGGSPPAAWEIGTPVPRKMRRRSVGRRGGNRYMIPTLATRDRSEEHTSGLKTQFHLVCRRLLVHIIKIPPWDGPRVDGSRADASRGGR